MTPYDLAFAIHGLLVRGELQIVNDTARPTTVKAATS
jgi:hypothetical protein